MKTIRHLLLPALCAALATASYGAGHDLSNPALFLCAEVNTFKANGSPAHANDSVRYWGDVRGMNQNAATAGRRWFKAVSPANEPKLVSDNGKMRLSFDGKSQWLTIGQVFTDTGGLNLFAAHTMIVVMKTGAHPLGPNDHLMPAAPVMNTPQIFTQQSQGATPITLNNTPQVLIGDQSFGANAALGLARTKGGMFSPSVWGVSYRWVNGSASPNFTYVATGANDKANDNQVHVLAATHVRATSLPAGSTVQNLTVNVFDNLTPVFHGNPPTGTSVVRMTSIAGGYAGATVTKGKDDKDNFLHAARFYQGEIAAVLIYEDALTESEVRTVTTALLRHPCTSALRGVKVVPLPGFHPHNP